jgi:hypothetical protein
MARLVALVPKPRAHLTRYHGVFAPASPDRARVVPRTGSAAANQAGECGEAAAGDRQRSLTGHSASSGCSPFRTFEATFMLSIKASGRPGCRAVS